MSDPKKKDFSDRIRWYYAIHTHFHTNNYNAVTSDYAIKNIYSRKGYQEDVITIKFISSKFMYDTNYRMFMAICFLHGAKNIHDIKTHYIWYMKKYEIHKNYYRDILGNFEKDMIYIRKEIGSMNNALKSVTNQIPIFIELAITENVAWESVVIMDNIFGRLCGKSDDYSLTNYIDKKYNTIMWDKHKNVIKKYSAFFSCKDDSFYHATTRIINKTFKKETT